MAPTLLSLCSGYGGLDLAVELAFGCRVVGYVERDAYAAAVLLARMEDASLAPAPVWCGDAEELDPAPFLGVDLITAGFSCQPWSSAGKRRGIADERWIWPAIAALIRRVGPRYVFLENVRALISRGGLALVLGDLADLGFDAEWTVLSAAEVGASHKRERVFILARADGGGLSIERQQLSHDRHAQPRNNAHRRGVSAVGDADGPGREGHRRAQPGWRLFPPGPGDASGWAELLRREPGLEPSLRRDADGTSEWMGLVHASRDDQLRLLGNGVVPLQAAVALAVLAERLHHGDRPTPEGSTP